MDKRLSYVSRYVTYNPEQVWLLPPSVREELGEGHVAVFVHELVERLDVRRFEQESSEQGRPGYPPQLLLKVWLYAYAPGVTSSRRIEQRVQEDLGFRLLAGNLRPDHWTLNEFRKRHPKALNDVFTQVVEAARRMGMGQLGRVAIDSTRVAANASPDRSDSLEQLRRERARIRQRIRRWQKQCDRDEQEPAGGAAPAPVEWQHRLDEIPRQLEQLRKSGQRRGSESDPESRYLRRHGGFLLGYTAELAVSDDHLIVAQRVHQAPADHGSLEAMTAAIERECGQRPATVMADAGYYSMEQIRGGPGRRSRSYCAGPVDGQGTGGRGGGGRNECPATASSSGPAATSRADARADGAPLLCAAQGAGRAGVRGAKTTTRHASVPTAGTASSLDRVGSGHHRLQPDPPVRPTEPGPKLTLGFPVPLSQPNINPAPLVSSPSFSHRLVRDSLALH
jgi:transposase